MTDTNAKAIWETLSAVDCTDHVEQKNGLSYLSWAWAWGMLMKYFPDAQYQFHEHEMHNDLTVTVHCSIRIGEVERSMWLPVMDYKNRAIQDPNAREISDTRMRCLVKCIAMFGLGHYIYAGEDLPDAGKSEKAEKEKAEKEEKPRKPSKPKPSKQDDDLDDLDDDGLDDLGDVDPEETKPEKEKSGKVEGDHIDTPEAAAFMVGQMTEVASEFCDSKEELRDFYVKNAKVIRILKEQYPEQYEELQKEFKQIANRIDEKE